MLHCSKICAKKNNLFLNLVVTNLQYNLWGGDLLQKVVLGCKKQFVVFYIAH